MALRTRHTMSTAALLMGTSIFLSRIMGLVRDKIISWQFGATADTDVYFAAFVIPDFINYLLAGGYISITLIPLLTKRFEEDSPDAWRFFSAVLCCLVAAVSVFSLVAMIWAPQLAYLTAPGFAAHPEKLERLSLYLRLILPGQIFFIAGAAFTALLYIRKMFFAPALVPLVYNGCIILAGLVFPLLPGIGRPDMTGYALGVLAGTMLGALLLPLWAAAKGGLRLELRFSHPLLWRYVRLALPLMLGQSIVVLDEQLLRVFASFGAEGSVSLINYARRIMLVPVGVVAQAAGMASFPFLAALAAKHDEEAFHNTLQSALKNSLLVIVPLSAYMAATAPFLLGLIFEGGRFSAHYTREAAPLLQILLISVPFWAIQQVVGRAFYARQNTLTPALVGTLVTVVALPAYWLVARFYLAVGIVSVSVASLAAYTLALCLVWGTKHGTRSFQGLVGPVCRAGGLALLAALAALFTATATLDTLIAYPLHFFLRHLVCLGTSGLIFGMVYCVGAWLILPQGLFFLRRFR